MDDSSYKKYRYKVIIKAYSFKYEKLGHAISMLTYRKSKIL